MTASATLLAYRWGMDADQARDLYLQVLELRGLLEAVARELERLAASPGTTTPRRSGARRGGSLL